MRQGVGITFLFFFILFYFILFFFKLRCLPWLHIPWFVDLKDIKLHMRMAFQVFLFIFIIIIIIYFQVGLIMKLHMLQKLLKYWLWQLTWFKLNILFVRFYLLKKKKNPQIRENIIKVIIKFNFLPTWTFTISDSLIFTTKIDTPIQPFVD